MYVLYIIDITFAGGYYFTIINFKINFILLHAHLIHYLSLRCASDQCLRLKQNFCAK